jgi:hypothetical protein
MAFIKNFCRLITNEELDDSDVIEFFDIVQNVVPTKLLTAYTADNKEVVSVEVIAYANPSNNEQNVYEIILSGAIDPDEGDTIAQQLNDAFDFDFDFEASIEV